MKYLEELLQVPAPSGAEGARRALIEKFAAYSAAPPSISAGTFAVKGDSSRHAGTLLMTWLASRLVISGEPAIRPSSQADTGA